MKTRFFPPLVQVLLNQAYAKYHRLQIHPGHPKGESIIKPAGGTPWRGIGRLFY
jgi:hypothetical protein